MTEKEKAEESLKWLKIFKGLVAYCDLNSLSKQGLFNKINSELKELENGCKKVLEDENV